MSDYATTQGACPNLRATNPPKHTPLKAFVLGRVSPFSPHLPSWKGSSHSFSPDKASRGLPPAYLTNTHPLEVLKSREKGCSLLVYLLRRQKWGFVLRSSWAQQMAVSQEKQSSPGSRTKRVIKNKPQSTKNHQIISGRINIPAKMLDILTAFTVHKRTICIFTLHIKYKVFKQLNTDCSKHYLLKMHQM